MSHSCHWPSCKTEVPPKLLMCRGHWYRLPKPLRDRIWETYRHGQEVTKTPSREYIAVAVEVQAWCLQWIEDHPEADKPVPIKQLRLDL